MVMFRTGRRAVAVIVPECRDRVLMEMGMVAVAGCLVQVEAANGAE
jgi:hypothetical protein